MAPELFRGTPASPQSDIYALGVMLFHTLSGRLPFIADNIHQIIQLHQHQPIPDINESVAVPDALDAILKRCLAKSPADRYATARELADSFQLALHRLRDTESLVRESAKGLDCFIQGARDTFRVIIPQPGDRLQEVIIEVTEGKNNEQYLSVFSVCGPADPELFCLCPDAQCTPDVRQHLDSRCAGEADVCDVANVSSRHCPPRGAA